VLASSLLQASLHFVDAGKRAGFVVLAAFGTADSDRADDLGTCAQ